jgi:exopolyphosphatase/guanosine-5'-triphosphate,3'-diphosphate pyrophosphatase
VSVKDEVVAQPDSPGHVAPTSARGDLPSAPPVRHNGRPPWPHAHHRRAAPQNGHSYAALDLGTNNCRLLVAEPAP